MNWSLEIPRSVREQIANPAPSGQRHQQIVKIASTLVARGFQPDEIFCHLRPSYSLDLSDAEIQSVIRWANSNIPIRSNSRTERFRQLTEIRRRCGFHPLSQIHFPALNPEEAISRYLGSFSCDESDLFAKSPVRLAESWQEDSTVLLNHLYAPDENVNIVSAFKHVGSKAQPTGFGKTQSREKWLADFAREGPPNSASGVWIRPNPTDGKGISDTNIRDFRIAVVELDSVTLSQQVAFMARVPIPISAIITSGGRSVHAWVLVAAVDLATYRRRVLDLFHLLAPFGIDTANRNPSRLSRLPGVKREIGGIGDRRQRLLYLNPAPTVQRIIP